MAMHYSVMVGKQTAGLFSPGKCSNYQIMFRTWIRALQESGCSLSEDGMISIHLVFTVMLEIYKFSLKERPRPLSNKITLIMLLCLWRKLHWLRIIAGHFLYKRNNPKSKKDKKQHKTRKALYKDYKKHKFPFIIISQP